jgi:hypothetical protein
VTAGSSRRRGGLVARVLSGAWRAGQPPIDITEGELREIEPLLLAAGAGGLAWARLRGTPLEALFTGGAMHQAYRFQAVTMAVREARIVEVFEALRAAGVEPILGKGWAAARLYPGAGRRPCGDIDLYVRARDHARAAAALRGEAGELVDLHRGHAELDDWPEEELFGRSRLLRSGAGSVRVFGSEDHLRLLALHALRHGLLRSLWLCDVAAALESAGEDFDWSRFRGGRRRRAEWAMVALDAAHAILGASRAGSAHAPHPAELRRWLAPVVLREWGTLRTLQGARKPVADLLRHPSVLARALVLRWPNPVEATIGVGASFGGTPRWALQIGESVRRTIRFTAARARS